MKVSNYLIDYFQNGAGSDELCTNFLRPQGLAHLLSRFVLEYQSAAGGNVAPTR